VALVTMNHNLDTLKDEIGEYVESQGLIVFPTISRVPDGVPAAYWDAEKHPDFRAFVAAAKAGGARIVLLQTHQLTEEELDDAADSLSSASLPRDEQRAFERRLKELRAYQGFTSLIELSFDQPERVYIFEVRAEWYSEYEDMMDEIESFTEVSGDEPLGGYYSQN
jgi:hypothetical protein